MQEALRVFMENEGTGEEGDIWSLANKRTREHPASLYPIMSIYFKRYYWSLKVSAESHLIYLLLSYLALQ